MRKKQIGKKTHSSPFFFFFFFFFSKPLLKKGASRTPTERNARAPRRGERERGKRRRVHSFFGREEDSLI